jgi:alpha-N-arabinofuranosidase
MCELVGLASAKVKGRVLTAEKLDAHNTFEVPDNIAPAVFDGASINGDNILAEIPPRSVVVLRLAQ